MRFTTDRIANFNAALANSHQARLNWVVNSHEDVSSYIIEHTMSKTQFDSVGTVVDGNTNQYVFEDGHLNTGANYYRVRIVLADGTFDYSNIAIVNGNADERKTINTTASYQLSGQGWKNLIRVNIPLGLGQGQYTLNRSWL